MKRILLVFTLLCTWFAGRAQVIGGYLGPAQSSSNAGGWYFNSVIGQTITGYDSSATGYFSQGYAQGYSNATEPDSHIARFPIGSLTPINVRVKEATAFYFYSGSLPKTSILSCRFTSRGVDSSFDGNLIFKDTNTAYIGFTVPETITRPFYLILYARNPANLSLLDSQAVLITPEKNPAPEAVSFGVGTSQTYPDPTSRDYFIITDDSSTQTRMLNGRSAKPRTVEIAGIELVVDENLLPTAEGNIYARFHSKDSVTNTNIESLTIYADKLTVKSHWKLPATNVTIYARQLIFEDYPGRDYASIDASGLKSLFNPNDGIIAHGSKGGNFKIYVKDYQDPKYLFRFITRGGFGENGVEGSANQTAHEPGNGGDGGSMEANINLAPFTDMAPGISGTQHGTLVANIYKGKTGTSQLVNRELAWLHPHYLRLVQRFIDDVYFLGFTSSAHDMAAMYGGFIDEAELANSISSNPDKLVNVDLNYCKQKLYNTANKIESGLDYMGNTPGWVPMLSFQANATAFANQIDPAFNAIYLAGLIKRANQSSVAKFTAIDNSIANLKAQVTKDNNDLGQLAIRVPILDQKVNTYQQKVDNLTNEANNIEAELKRRAEKSVADRKKRAAIGGIMSSVGSMLTMIPSPWTIGAGAALSVAGNFIGGGQSLPAPGDISGWVNFGVKNGSSLANAYNATSTTFGQNQTNFMTGLQNVTSRGFCGNSGGLSSFIGCAQQQAGDIGSAFGPYATAATNLYNNIKPVVANSDEVGQELSRLVANEPRLGQISNEIKNLQDEISRTLAEIKATNSEIQNVGQRLTHNTQSVGFLSGARSFALGRIDMRMVQYVNNMEQVNLERLKKYQYFMAKSWEYTTCSPYPGNLNLANVLTRLRTMLDTANAGTSYLSQNDLNALKTIYMNELNTTRDNIISTAQNSGFGSSISVKFDLPAQQIADLQNRTNNNLTTVTWLNIVKDLNVIPAERENLRIKRLWVDAMDIIPTVAGQTFPSGQSFTFSVIYPNISQVKFNGQIYKFTNGTRQSTRSNYQLTSDNYTVSWDADLDPNASSGGLVNSAWDVDDICSALNSNGLANSFLASCNAATIMTRQALDADLRFEFHPSDTLVAYKIKNIRIGVEYYYKRRSPDNIFLTVQPTIKDIKPVFELSQNDINGRKDGYGSISRTYDPTQTLNVTVKAPIRYGRYQFKQWIGGGTGVATNPLRTVTITQGSDVNVKAQYELLYAKAKTPDTVWVDPSYSSHSSYFRIKSLGNDSLEFVADSVQVVTPGFGINTINSAYYNYIKPSGTDSIPIKVPDNNSSQPRILGIVKTFAPHDSQFVHQTLVLQKGVVGIPPLLSSNRNLLIVPNPNNGQFYIDLPENTGKISVAIIDIYGKTLFTESGSFGSRYAPTDVVKLPSGAYTVIIRAENSPPAQGRFIVSQ